MTDDERRALLAADFRVATVAEFLGLTEEESRTVEMRLVFEESWTRHEAGYRRLAGEDGGRKEAEADE